jgi:hypothetical protein
MPVDDSCKEKIVDKSVANRKKSLLYFHHIQFIGTFFQQMADSFF